MANATITGTAPAVPRVPRTALPVAALVAAMLGLAALLGLPHLDQGPFLPSPALPWWVLALAFAATEYFVLHIQGKREGQTISLDEIPLVIGLFFVSPVVLLVARLVGNGAVMALHRRIPPVKLVFNMALVTAVTAVAVAIFAPVLAWADEPSPVTWMAACLAVLLSNAVGLVAIRLVIAAHEGGLRWLEVCREAVQGQAPAPLALLLGLISVTSLWASPDSAWLLALYGGLTLVAFRVYATLSDRHLNLERLYRFSQAVGSAPEIDDVLAGLLGEARQMLHAERASAAFLAADGSLIARVRLGATNRLTRSEEPPTEEDAWVLSQVVDGGTSLLMPRTTRDPDARGWLAGYGMRDAIVVPLRGGAGVIGALVVADRLGDVRSFEKDDLLLLETVANHAGIALRNGELLGQLRHEALHDALTGLPNREHLQRRVAAALDDVAAGRTSGATVMILDLDDFKEVNDTLGHQQGDILLTEVATRLSAVVGTTGTVARLGGDEFAILLPTTADEERVLRVGRRILRALEQPMALDGLDIEVSGSLGIALAPAHADEPAALLKRADMAMYDAKTSTRGLRLYEADLETNTPRRLTLVSELRAALQNGGIEVHVQPKARLGSGDVVSVEALVRWDHPELGDVSPDEFIPLAERTGLIGKLTSRVLDAALAACAEWRAAGHDLGVAVNLSTWSLHDADLVEEVGRLLRRHGVAADRLTLEVTEGSVMADPSRSVALLHQLRDLGVRLSVDDFGTGYSSLSYLKRLPVQEVKIDRSFVSGLREQGEDVAIVRAIIDLGHHLGLQVVAEGVEDQATWDLLGSMNCDLVQGWHLARAMPIAELVPWLTSRQNATARGGLRAV